MKRPTFSPRKQALDHLSDDRGRSRREVLATLSAVGAGIVLAPSASIAQTVDEVRSGSITQNANGAQTPSKTVRRPERYEDSLIFERKPFTWPGGKTLAVWIIPKAVEEMKKRRWEFMGHGITNSQLLSSTSSVDEERNVIQTALRTIEHAVGERPKGWLGPGLAETFNTLDILAEEGVRYVGDWNNDD